MLSGVSTKEYGQVMNALSKTDELVIFKSDLIRDLIAYKWQAWSGKVHAFSCINHVIYIACILYYINNVFLCDIPKLSDGSHDLNWNAEPHKTMLVIIGICLTYSVMYEGIQMKNTGIKEYL